MCLAAALRRQVLVLVEGIEPQTSCTLQARHSYCASEMVWDHDFAPCVFRDLDGRCQIDFRVFHDLVPAQTDGGALRPLPPPPSHS